MIAFDRLLARLIQSQPDQWVLKGGLALQLRLGDRARTTKDIDLLYLTKPKRVFDSLSEAVSLDLGDWFSFEVGRPSNDQDWTAGGIRHTVISLLDGALLSGFTLMLVLAIR
jgi:hypothetical protein